MKPTLYYFHDPMCSWCWGFRRTWIEVQKRLSDRVSVQYILGGLAADTDEPMPEAMRTNIQNNWKRIQEKIPGTEFNFDFWTDCQPRRSTYASCRAILATRQQNPALEKDMHLAIQHAYYLNARNPSDSDVLIDLAKTLKLDTDKFSKGLSSAETQKQLISEIHLARDLGVESFPSLVLLKGEEDTLLRLDYNNADVIVSQIEEIINHG